MRIDDIPSAAEPPPDARPSSVVARIRDLRPSRRTVLKGLFVAAAAASLVPLDWYLARRQAHAAGDGPRTEFMECEEGGYDEERNNWPSGGSPMCIGGFRRGSFPCKGGWHREGEFRDDDDTATVTSTRAATNCHGRNAWRWKSVRCSDAMTTISWDDGDEYTGKTIAVCGISA
ncbi:hypothetical protein ACQEVB_20375 [Pseudonocardia sp. CA-107938]|uniref:hypothetical protein n=1 Tax=Pseudonocardia sp. CA-107938 TaxID=3240021 RepID=UPI003D8FC11E